MKERIRLLFVVTMLIFALTACGGGSDDSQSADAETAVNQTATAYLSQDADDISSVTVKLDGGYSVKFAKEAAYLYEGAADENTESVATLVQLEKDVYAEYQEQANADENKEEADGGVYFTLDDGEGAYITSVEDTAFFLITSLNKDDIHDLAARFALALY